MAPVVLSPGLAPSATLGSELSADIGTWLLTEALAVRPTAQEASSVLPPAARGTPSQIRIPTFCERLASRASFSPGN